MNKPASLSELGPLQFVILVLSFLVLGALVVELAVTVPPETARVLRWIDNAACAVFLTDFILRYRAAESKLQFMKWGWVDLLASVPEVAVLRWGRIFRVIRILRLIRALRSLRSVLHSLFSNRLRGGIASVFVIMFLVLSLSSAGILLVEHDPDSNIRNAEDAVWWSLTTITTVGYGDRYPVTLPGRIIAGVLMVSGVGLFGTLSGVIASFFLGGGQKNPQPASGSPSGLDAVRDELAALRFEVTALRTTMGAPPGGCAGTPLKGSPAAPTDAPAEYQ
jgi:voltage-gated potassium channel